MKQNELAETTKLIGQHTTEGTHLQCRIPCHVWWELHWRVMMKWMVIIELKYSYQKE